MNIRQRQAEGIAAAKAKGVKFGRPKVYNAEDYELFCDNPLYPLVCQNAYSYIQTDKLRDLYDTDEVVTNLLGMDYVSDSEILANSSEGSSSVSLPAVADKKKQKEILNKIKKGGL